MVIIVMMGLRMIFLVFAPFVKKFGVIIFHDTMWDYEPSLRADSPIDMGVPKFLEELRKKDTQL